MTTAEVHVPDIMTRDKYGVSIDTLAINAYVVIPKEDRQAVLQLIKRKYKKTSIPIEERRMYRTAEQGGEIRLFRLK